MEKVPPPTMTYSQWEALPPESQEDIPGIVYDVDGYPFVCECGNLMNTDEGNCLLCDNPLCSTCQEVDVCFRCFSHSWPTNPFPEA